MNKTMQNHDTGGTRLEERFGRIVSPFQTFMHDQATASVILIVCTLVALLIANSHLSADYHELLQTPFGFSLGEWSLRKSLHFWINDGLMAIFFFILGLEIKREILAGDLRSRRRVLPVMAAAMGGMLFPAAIYFIFNYQTDAQHGWGIPMATDTAFAVGMLALLGKRIPKSLTAFLAALAIIDDIGAILVIAIVYTESIQLTYLSMAGGLLVVLILFNALGVRRPGIYLFFGAIVWYAMLKSGVHATIAGILVALTIPARPKKGKRWFVNHIHRLLKQLEQIENKRPEPAPILAESEQHAVLENVEETVKKTTTPLQRWESGLEHPVALFVLPVFALANAGIAIDSGTFSALYTETLTIGIVLALVPGKCIGISLFGWLVTKTGWGDLPPGMTTNHLLGIGLLGGVGFTMSIFITGLSFSSLPEYIVMAKSGILFASLIAGIAGYLWLYRTGLDR